MSQSSIWQMIVPIANILLVFGAASPTFKRLICKLGKGDRDSDDRQIYEDKDGIATEASQRSFRSSRVASGVILLASIIGASSCLLSAILFTSHSNKCHYDQVVEWLPLLFWTLLIMQAVNLVLEKNLVERFSFATKAAGSFGVCILTNYFQWYASDRARLRFEFAAVETISLFVGLAASLSVPRRPAVYYNGNILDGQRSVSIISRLTYSWVAPLLAVAAARKEILLEELPEMDHKTRSRELHDIFNTKPHQGPFPKRLVLAHAPALIRVYFLTILASILDFAPQLAMFKLLHLLEIRQSEDAETKAAVIWAIILGLSMVLKTITENWLAWVSRNQIHIPVRVQLSGLIFSKMMRRKDVKMIRKRESAAEIHQWPSKGMAEELKTNHGTINLAAIDTKRIGEFFIHQHEYIAVFWKIAISVIFLLKLIGWQALLAGIFVQILFMPLNIYFAKKYTKSTGMLMEVRDRKLAVISEVLAAIRQIKFSTLESLWKAKVMELRKNELRVQYSAFLADSVLVFCWLAGPVLLSAISIAVYVTINQTLTASIAFTTISVLTTLQSTLTWIPELATYAIDAWTSLKRIERYMEVPEKPVDITFGDSISFENATFTWPSDDVGDPGAFQMRNVTLAFLNQELNVIYGPTGSGKSLFLSAILGEIELLAGCIRVPKQTSTGSQHTPPPGDEWLDPSAIAFVDQRPWIENCTFRDNILFGLPYHLERYNKVLHSTSLLEDLKEMPDGDQTEIGASGINLSGGQRWRLTLARALYSRAGILLLDDIFSAVDIHVGKHLLEHAICGELCNGRTRILVTHHAALCLPRASYMVRLQESGVEYAGEVKEEDRDEDQYHIETKRNGCCGEKRSEELIVSADNSTDGDLNMSASDNYSILRSESTYRTIAETNDASTVLTSSNILPRRFVENETKLSGQVAASVYKRYMTSAGHFVSWAGVLISFCLYEVAILGSSWWLTLWTRSSTVSSYIQVVNSAWVGWTASTHLDLHSARLDSNLKFYLGIYLGISIFISLLGAFRYFLIYRRSIAISQQMFEIFTTAIFYAPLRWIDTVPLGRILNRSTADFNVIDSELGPAVAHGISFTLRVVGILIAGTFVSLRIVIIALLLFGASSYCVIYCLEGAREVKRLESLARSPVYDLFSVSLTGLTTIRAWGRSGIYVDKMFAKIDDHSKTLWYTWAFFNWLVFRFGVISAAFSTATAILVVFLKNIDAPLAGFALSFTLDYSDAVMWASSQYVEVELGMNAVERVLEYSDITTEDQSGLDVPAAWPTDGRLDIVGLEVRYAPDLPPVLKELTFRVEPRERIGVVGRTGAGKSSLALALFRFLEATDGSICIDGSDISKLRLHDLRSRLAIIPQDPVLFSGTLRSNLDPCNSYSDVELRSVLSRVYLLPSAYIGDSSETLGSNVNPEQGTPITNQFYNLNAWVSEGGHNFSQGQRQLLCLARAMLCRPKIIVLDEATSAVDKDTDILIQRSLREEFCNSTLLVIAHRISTVADFDKILVLEAGRLVEFGTPQDLLQAGGAFANMF